jgi:hypothetical protein
VQPEPENCDVVGLYHFLHDQWQQSGGRIVLENTQIESAMNMLSVSERDRLSLLVDVKVMAAAIRSAVEKETEKERSHAAVKS